MLFTYFDQGVKNFTGSHYEYVLCFSLFHAWDDAKNISPLRFYQLWNLFNMCLLIYIYIFFSDYIAHCVGIVGLTFFPKSNRTPKSASGFKKVKPIFVVQGVLSQRCESSEPCWIVIFLSYQWGITSVAYEWEFLPSFP